MAWEWEEDTEPMRVGSVGFQAGFSFAEITVNRDSTDIQLFVGELDGVTLEVVQAAIEALFAQIEAARKGVA
jgi:hypothetical protein